MKKIAKIYLKTMVVFDTECDPQFNTDASIESYIHENLSELIDPDELYENIDMDDVSIVIEDDDRWKQIINGCSMTGLLEEASKFIHADKMDAFLDACIARGDA